MPGSTDCADHQGCVPVARVDPRDAEIADLRRRLEVTERGRDSEAGRDYWCDTCARASQSNEAGTCLVCGDDLVHVSEIPTLRADLARVTADRDEARRLIRPRSLVIEYTERERDAAIARAEAAEKRDATRIEGIMAQIADLERDRDHWRTVAESRPDISREDAGKVALAPTDDLAAVIRVSDALRAHAAAPKGDDTNAPKQDAEPCIECDGAKFVYERSDFDDGTFRIPCPECNRTGRAGGAR